MAKWSWWPLAGVVLAAVVFARIRGMALVGLDTLPILATADFAGAWFERLMPDHNMFRPILSLWVSLDKAVFGLRSWGFQFSNALAYLGAGLGVGFCAKKLLGSNRAALTAMLVLLLHPSMMDVVPAVERRSELMLVGFMAMAIGYQVEAARTPERKGRWAPLAPPFFAILAMGSKDNGVLALPLMFCTAFLYSGGTFFARVRQTFWVSGPTFLATGVFLYWRGQQVGGLGGRNDRNPLSLVLQHPAQLPQMIDRILRPEPYADTSPVTGLTVGLFLLLFVAAWALGARDQKRNDPAPKLRAAVVGLLWIELSLVIYAARGVWRLWYALLLAAGFALVLASSVEVLSVRLRTPPSRHAAAAALVALVLAVGWQGRYSMPFGNLDAWNERTARMDAFYPELHRRVAAAKIATIVVCPTLPEKIDPPPGEAHYDTVRDVTKTTIRAYLALAFPDLRVRLRPSSKAKKVRINDGIVLVHSTF